MMKDGDVATASRQKRGFGMGKVNLKKGNESNHICEPLGCRYGV